MSCFCGACGGRDHLRHAMGFHGGMCRDLTPCCPVAVTTVKCIINEECHGCREVLLRITGRFAELGLEKCFRLLLCPNTMENTNTNPVFLVDGERKFPLIQAHTGNVVRYDQLVELVDFHRRRHCGKEISLECFMGSDGAPDNRVHVIVRTRLPKTTFVSTPDISGAAEGAGEFRE